MDVLLHGPDATAAQRLSRRQQQGQDPSEADLAIRQRQQRWLEPLVDSDTLELLLGQYLGDCNSSLARWLLSRSDEELLVTIEPSRLFSWDYRERMADAV